MSWLRIDDRGPVRWITLDRPQRKNAIPFDGWADLAAAFIDFEASPGRVLVVTGAGGDFCSGADLDPARIGELGSVEARHRRMKVVTEAATALHRITKPVLAAVDGVAVGAGMNLALGCDLVVATDRARFAELFVRRGLTVDFGGSWLLPRIVGLQRAKELALTGRMVSAEEALRIGLVAEVVAPDLLEARVGEIVDSLLAGAPVAQMFAKLTIDAAFESGFGDALAWESQTQAIALGTEDAGEGVASFLEKRPPVWKGR